MSDPVLPWLGLRAGETDVHERACDSDQHAVQDELRVKPPSDPHGNSECSDERRWRHDIDQDSPCAAQEKRDRDCDEDHFHQESSKQYASPLDRHTFSPKLLISRSARPALTLRYASESPLPQTSPSLQP